MKTLSDGQRAALSLAAAVLCGVGTMFVPEVQLEAGQEVTVGHVIAMGASLVLKVAVIPLLGTGLVYGAMHLARKRRLAREGGQAKGDTTPDSAIEPDTLDDLLVQATLDGDLHWVWLPSESYWMAARQRCLRVGRLAATDFGPPPPHGSPGGAGSPLRLPNQ